VGRVGVVGRSKKLFVGEYEVACRKKVARLRGALFQTFDLEIEVRNRECYLRKNDIMDTLEPMGLLPKVHRSRGIVSSWLGALVVIIRGSHRRSRFLGTLSLL